MKQIVLNILRLMRNLFGSLIRLLRFKSPNFPSLGSMTIDRDDVKLAKNLLKDKSLWDDLNMVRDYEKTFAQWNGSKHAFAFMGGRIALSACIYSLNLDKNDEVILPGYTCVVVPNAFHFSGIKTVYCDIELDTYGLDANLIEEKITPKTKAIMLHHLYGLVSRDYEKILELAKKYNLKVIEDCAHSTGAVYKGKKVGNYGDVAFYSSEQSKIFTTIQGGMAVTNDDLLAKRIKEYYESAPYPENELIDKQLNNVVYNYYLYKHPYRWLFNDVLPSFYKDKQLISTTHKEECGIKPYYYGQRMPAPIASIGITQLKKIDYYNNMRRKTAAIWDKWCDKNGYRKPVVIKDSIPVYLRYPVIVEEEKKKNTRWATKKLGVRLGVWFVSNIHPADWTVEGCPKADEAVRRCINFPCLGLVND